MGRTTNTVRSVFWGAVNTIISLGLPFVSRSILIYYLGVEYVGLGSLFTSVLQVLSFTELGIGSALVYSMYEPIANGNDTKVRALLNFYKSSYKVIGSIVLVLGLLISPFLDQLVEGSIPGNINLQYLFWIYLTNNVVSYFVFAEKSSLLLACQRDDINSQVSLLTKVILNGTQILLIVLFKNYYLYTICIPICTIINNVLVNRIARKVYPQYYCEGIVEKSELNTIKKNVGGLIFQKIGNIVLGSVDTIVISGFLGLKVLGIYNNYYYIYTSLDTFLGMIRRALTPSVGNSIASESKEKNFHDFQKFHMLYEWIIVWWSACILCLAQPFMEIWVGKSVMFSDSFLVLFVVYFFCFKWLDMIHVYREASGIWWEGRWMPLIAAAVNLFFNILLVQIIGLSGVMLSTIICLLAVHDTVGVYILKKYYFKKIMNLRRFYLRQGYVILSAVVVCVLSYLACQFFEFQGILLIVVRFIICMILPNILLALLWKKFGTTAYILDMIKTILLKSIRGRKK